MDTVEIYDDPLQDLILIWATIISIPGAIKSAWEHRQELAPIWGRYFLTFMLGALFGVLLLRGNHARLTRDEPIVTIADRIAASVETVTSEPVSKTETAEEAAQAAFERQAQYMARVLYGTAKSNTVAQQKAVCWCILNRVESDRFPSSVEEVCAQPGQWMGYSNNNPVIRTLYEVAAEVLNEWLNGDSRMIPREFLYLSWSESEIVLRTSFVATDKTRYWNVG